jgi:hypothetical protein
VQLEKRLRLGRISKAEYKAEMARLNREEGIEDDDGLVDAAIHGAPAFDNLNTSALPAASPSYEPES